MSRKLFEMSESVSALCEKVCGNRRPGSASQYMDQMPIRIGNPQYGAGSAAAMKTFGLHWHGWNKPTIFPAE